MLGKLRRYLQWSELAKVLIKYLSNVDSFSSGGGTRKGIRDYRPALMHARLPTGLPSMTKRIYMILTINNNR